MEENKIYSSVSIPIREVYKEVKSFPCEDEKENASEEGFAEIEIQGASPVRSGVPLPQKQPISEQADPKKAAIYKMREIGRGTDSFCFDSCELFYKQASLMRDFEDDYSEKKDFSSYFPTYQKMSYEQLRTYFTWRTEVRRGNITNIGVSYAFTYIYELLDNICDDKPEESLEKLYSFWVEYRKLDETVDKYVIQWIKDFHVFYNIQKPFCDFAREHSITEYYPTVFGYSSTRSDSFKIFLPLSKYDITKSVFYNEKTLPIISDCFYFVLINLREAFEKQNKRFEDYVFFPLVYDSVWTPFSSSMFYPARQDLCKQYVISEREIYSRVGSRWFYKSVIITDDGKKLIGYILKEIEVNLRIRLKFKHKLKASTDMCNEKYCQILEETAISLPDFIKNCVLEFFAMSTRKKISVDKESLLQIRKESLLTQEKLIVPEQEEIIEKQPEVILSEKEITENPWTLFVGSLTEIEKEALRLMLLGENIKDFAKKNATLPQVIADNINQKAADVIGDTVLEYDVEALIYDDYKEKLTDIL